MNPGGLLIAGRTVQVPGLRILNAADEPWITLDPGDYRMRKTTWVRQVMLHTTKGDWPQYVRAGAGPGGKGRVVADFWHRDPTHSAAHIVIDNNGTVYCLANLAYACAYHATVSNDWSVGIELYQESDGGIYEAVYDAAVKLIPALCDAMSIPFQVVADTYNGHPLTRMLNGGMDVVGIVGHRDNTENRGRGDPGDEIFDRLIDAGAEPVLITHGQDLELAKARQKTLRITADGLVGPASMAAARKAGYSRWSHVPV